MSEPPAPKAIWDTAFEPYAASIGYLIREWNHLQEKFCDLFCTIMEPATYDVSSSVWYAIQNDRLQRSILLAAAAKRFSSKPHAKCLKGIEWAVTKANSLGSQRDDTIHSPVSILIGDPIEFISKYFFGHPRALNLKNKNLLTEFELYRQNAVILVHYLTKLERHARALVRNVPPERQQPLPEKPQLLTAPKKTKAKFQ